MLSPLDKQHNHIVTMIRARSISIPDGQRLLYVVRKGMETGLPLRQAAKISGVSHDTYTFVRKLLILKDSGFLTTEDDETTVKALAILDETNLLEPARSMTLDIINKYWNRKTRTGTRVDRKHPSVIEQTKQKKRLDNTLFLIREACCNNDEMEIPTLTSNERSEAMDLIIESMGSLWQLFYRIKGGSHDKNT